MSDIPSFAVEVVVNYLDIKNDEDRLRKLKDTTLHLKEKADELKNDKKLLEYVINLNDEEALAMFSAIIGEGLGASLLDTLDFIKAFTTKFFDDVEEVNKLFGTEFKSKEELIGHFVGTMINLTNIQNVYDAIASIREKNTFEKLVGLSFITFGVSRTYHEEVSKLKDCVSIIVESLQNSVQVHQEQLSYPKEDDRLFF